MSLQNSEIDDDDETHMSDEEYFSPVQKEPLMSQIESESSQSSTTASSTDQSAVTVIATTAKRTLKRCSSTILTSSPQVKPTTNKRTLRRCASTTQMLTTLPMPKRFKSSSTSLATLDDESIELSNAITIPLERTVSTSSIASTASQISINLGPVRFDPMCKHCRSNKVNITCIPCGHCYCTPCWKAWVQSEKETHVRLVNTRSKKKLNNKKKICKECGKNVTSHSQVIL